MPIPVGEVPLHPHCHYDRISGAAAIPRTPANCSLVAHELDAAYIRPMTPR